MIEETKYCIDMMKKNFNKEIVMAKKDNEGFKSTTKCWICDNDYVVDYVKIRNHCHTTRKYRCSAHRDCDINVKLNHKTPAVFHNLKHHDLHLIIQELGKFNLQINFIPNGLEKYMGFSINNN